MIWKSISRKLQPSTFLLRLLHDVRANTLVIAAVALIPLTAMVGSGLDMSRLWLTKTRMQHACDAAVLAGRKQMGGGTWNKASSDAADQFFKANFATGSYGSVNLDTAFSESGGKAVGKVAASLPMTLMKVLGFGNIPISVVCDADMRLPNTDIMFVLDTTGSMASPAVSGDIQTKIQGLRNAVKCFYEILAKLPTDAQCAATKPTGGTSGVQIRFGFVPYASNVNVGYLLPTSYIADSWTYQSRIVDSLTATFGPAAQYDQKTFNNNASCPPPPPNTATQQYSVVKTNSYFLIIITGTTCTYYRKDAVNAVNWRYGPITQNISGLKNGTSWNTNFTLPIGPNGTSKTVTWDGCIEERHTIFGTNFNPIPSDANDLDIDSVPVPGDVRTLWAPVLKDLIYTRQASSNEAISNNSSNWNRNQITTTAEFGNGSDYRCPRPARRLREWGDPGEFISYVDSLTPEGNTYHDIGLLWGARLLSPTGIFKSDNAKTAQGADIERHLIFMTDGDTRTSASDYTAYGVPWFDRRNVEAPSAATSSFDDEINARFTALCKATKNKNITLWVISFGSGSNTVTEDRLKTCATSENYYFKAADSASLQTSFNSIANQISQLRLTK